MNKLFSYKILLAAALFCASCNSFLDVLPRGVANEEDLQNAVGAEKLTVAAYASLGNDHWFEPYTSMWPYGNVRAGDAHKGGLGAADLGEYHQYEIFSTTRTDMDSGNRMWTRLYIGVQRANAAIKVLNTLDETTFKEKTHRLAEMRFLRAHYHFLLKILFKKIPYVTDDLGSDEVEKLSNDALGDNELWQKIADDFKFAVDNLPAQKSDVGRPYRTVAKAYLAKVRLFQAYIQDDQNKVTSINQEYLNEVITLTTEVIDSGEFGLFDDFSKNFLWSFDNGQESVFAVQRSKDDGSPIGRIDMSTALNYPMYPGYGCCSFHRPTQNLVNSFRTSATGLPLFNDYNSVSLKDSADFIKNTIDPRLDHTVGIPSHPYKYQENVIYRTATFTREPVTYGPYSAMKEVQQLSCPCLTTAQTYAYPSSSKNNVVIRFSDVILWKAEALIEAGRVNEALPLINQIRSRAKNSTNLLKYAGGKPISNYNMDIYKPGENITWNKATATAALRWERRLEFALEGYRFFDLVRWGVAAETLTEYFATEKTRVPHLSSAGFAKGRDEYLPVPEQQIQRSNRLYKQNNGW
ncbi:RagB/SusD family nutrient uptake outer membrane protein [Dyadobacter sp. CY323]|uniref:RagB/SusD family nutrient uptake outer membrane protein n=1 Tax=Dyadobacter sp. CY323 TaxID=2907302 RepID=UPI001F30DCA0|nr:RagB/SusD family nutrient uptake outer membrane protein [Dyadobacter sp. CY323]MCE6989751.1 RagB/SusD family nutrient uptake outer membrane protein [Dyadobacter sp. CY323]